MKIDCKGGIAGHVCAFAAQLAARIAAPEQRWLRFVSYPIHRWFLFFAEGFRESQARSVRDRSPHPATCGEVAIPDDLLQMETVTLYLTPILLVSASRSRTININ